MNIVEHIVENGTEPVTIWVSLILLVIIASCVIRHQTPANQTACCQDDSLASHFGKAFILHTLTIILAFHVSYLLGFQTKNLSGFDELWLGSSLCLWLQLNRRVTHSRKSCWVTLFIFLDYSASFYCCHAVVNINLQEGGWEGHDTWPWSEAGSNYVCLCVYCAKMESRSD